MFLGFANCADKSDENEKMCKDYICPDHTFQCSYGRCIRNEIVCDGIIDCINGKDEDKDLCSAINCQDKYYQKYNCKYEFLFI
jgi:hypothetical protein